MNIQSKFLLLFADYRDALQRAQRYEDENIVLRQRADEATKRGDELSDKLIEREREMTDRIMAIHFGQRVLKPHESPPVDAQSKVANIETPQQWSSRKWNQLLEDAKKIANG